MRLSLLLLLCCCGVSLSAAERINHEGRILGPVPTVAGPTLFNTAQADAVVAAMQIMPTDSPWNEDVSGLPLLFNSATMMTRINAALLPLGATHRELQAFQGLNFVVVPESQANVPITFVTKPGESDPSPYPIPGNLPIEMFPTGTGSLTLSQWQTDANPGDRHAIVVKPFSEGLWETYQTRLVGNTWQASNGAFFNLNSNVLRTDGFTSGDAAGLPIFPALVRYDEVQRGKIEHAMRLTVRRTRNAHLYPATDDDSDPPDGDLDVPAMGQRLRLKAAFSIPGTWSPEAKAVAIALKKYGCLVADNSDFFQISVTPDHRWPAGCFDDLNDLTPLEFEAVQSTGPTGGPRSTLTAKPTADAGSDQLIPPGTIVLAGSSTGTGTTVTWSLYPGAPGTVTFSNANLATSTATFTTPGVYTLVLQVADAVHTPAYDAVVITVSVGGVNPVPTLTSLSPSSALAGAASFVMTVQGANFAIGSATLSWSGQAVLLPDPASMTSTQMVVTVPASYVSAGGVPAIAVINGLPAGGTSANKPFIISALASGSGSSGSGEAEDAGGGCGAGAGLAFAALALLFGWRWRFI